MTREGRERGRKESTGHRRGRQWTFRRDAQSSGHCRVGTAAIAWACVGCPAPQLPGNNRGTAPPRGHFATSFPCSLCMAGHRPGSLYSETKVPRLRGGRDDWPLFWFEGHPWSVLPHPRMLGALPSGLTSQSHNRALSRARERAGLTVPRGPPLTCACDSPQVPSAPSRAWWRVCPRQSGRPCRRGALEGYVSCCES